MLRKTLLVIAIGTALAACGKGPKDADKKGDKPAVQLTMVFPAAEVEIWTPVPDLLADHAFDRHFVVDVDLDGSATLRFGDDEYGRRPEGVEGITARYRIGNGLAGNLGYGALVHIVIPNDPTALALWPDVREVRQPLPTSRNRSGSSGSRTTSTSASARSWAGARPTPSWRCIR